MAEFRKYEEMKKSELVEMCGLFGIKVGSKDTKQELIDKLNNRKQADKPAETSKTEAAETGRRGGRGRRGRAQDRQAAAAAKEAIKIETDSMLDRNMTASISELRPKVVKTAPKVDTTNKYLELKDQELAASMVDPFHTLTGRFGGPMSTETADIPGLGRVMYVNYMIDFGPYTVLIPSFFFWEDWRNQDKHPERRLYEQGLAMMGAEIDFNMVRRTKSVGGEIYGTRLLANKIKRCNNWYTTLPDGSYAIGEGSIVEAQVMRVRPFELIVDIYGVETRVDIRDISHLYEARANSIRDADGNLKYKAGTKTKVRVTNIKREDVPRDTSRFTFPVSCTASIKDAYENPQITYFDQYHENDTRYGEIVNIHKYPDSGKVIYYVKIRDQVVSLADLGPAIGKGGHMPKIGSEVKIRITEKKRATHQFYGLITWVDPNSKEAEDFSVLDLD